MSATTTALSVIVVWLASTLGVIVPILIGHYQIQSTRVMRLLRCISAGVVVGVGFLHVLPDAHGDLSELSNYPWAFFISMIGAFAVVLLEQILSHSHTEVVPKAIHASYVELQSQSMRVANLMEFGIVLHSIIIGIGLGATTNKDEVVTLVIAISFHQFFEGSGLSSYVCLAKPPLRQMIMMLGLFTITTPIGILIGFGVTDALENESRTALAVQGTFNALASGILIHMGFVELIAGEFHRLSGDDARGPVKLEMLFAISIGAGAMAMLAVWA
eukprot:c7696_g1_i1.p1 GENE.c7696_g1_i1~~c7696_g1_i1.p1  ORF type:complete len:273 (+),score=57.23 c7696_g1_i1:50-868(+)